MRVSAAGNMPLQGLVKPPAKPVVMILPAKVAERIEEMGILYAAARFLSSTRHFE